MMSAIISLVTKIWGDYGWWILIIGSLAIILILVMFRKGKTGTWSVSVPVKEPVNIPSSKRPSHFLPRESKGEIECRRVLEKIFDEPFPKIRPDFLKNPVTGARLEIDCYNHRLKLGVEYSGRQHAQHVSNIHSKEAFLNQKYRDELKARMCSDNGITLIVVPHTVKLEDIPVYLVQKLLETGYISPEDLM